MPRAGFVGAGFFALAVLFPATVEARLNPLLLAAETRGAAIGAEAHELSLVELGHECIAKPPIRESRPAAGRCKVTNVKRPRPPHAGALSPDLSCSKSATGVRQSFAAQTSYSPRAVPCALQAEIGTAFIRIHAGFGAPPIEGIVEAPSFAHPPDG